MGYPLWAYVLVMAGVTYLIRMLPLALFQRKLRSRWIKSFLFYVPYAVLAAMTIPAALESTSSAASAALGLVVAAVLAWHGTGLLGVALAGCAAVYAAEFLLGLWR